MVIAEDVYYRIIHSFCEVPPEEGCVLGEQNGVICAAKLDPGVLQMRKAVYIPDTRMINAVISSWAELGIHFAGIAHSHPNGQNTLSGDDVVYIHSIMQAMPDHVEKLYFPLVFSGDKMISFVAKKNGAGIEIFPDDIKITYEEC